MSASSSSAPMPSSPLARGGAAAAGQNGQQASNAPPMMDPLAFGPAYRRQQQGGAMSDDTMFGGSSQQGFDNQYNRMTSGYGDESQSQSQAFSGGQYTSTTGMGNSAETIKASNKSRSRPVAHEDVVPVVDTTAEEVRFSFLEFLEKYAEENASGSPDPNGDEGSLRYPYLEQIRMLPRNGSTTLYVNYTHILRTDDVLASAISTQYMRFLPYLRRAMIELVTQLTPEYLYINAQSVSTKTAGLKARNFNVSFGNLPLVQGIRDLRAQKLGRLVSISGTVTRTSEVRPELLYGTFKCLACNEIVRDVEQQFKYTEPVMCSNQQCQNRRQWQLIIEQSLFADWQKVRIQENANEIPTGSMPRSLDVILRSEIVERAKAGDKCIFTGSFIVVPDVSQLGVPGVNAQMQREASGGRAADGIRQGVSGIRALGVRDLTYKTAFLACLAQSTSNADDDDDEDMRPDPAAYLESLTHEERDELEAMADMRDIYPRLVKSVAPTVYGHDIVKKGILLQLMGGVHKQTPEGIHLRGDINICIVGDPSTSKSQFLKYVCSFLPRAIYTSGKASSAAGLTAAVVRDEETGELTIEAGALMLADNGICAIDEFDKMDVSDQVAIHEAMEQQTISIAKAGLQATLNARTSILAAANPVGGRYNRKLSLRANVAMSAPILSRFDLFFVVLDECNESVDMNIAKHIINVHRFKEEAIAPEFDTQSLQRYMEYARTFEPKLTPEASDVLVDKYRMLRQDDTTGGSSGKNSYRITVRQLESLIRLSEAIARLHCTNEVTPQFVREAYSLLKQSIIHVEKDDIDFDDEDDEEEEQDGHAEQARGIAARAEASGATDESMQEDSMQTSSSMAADGTAAPDTAVPSTGARQKVRITYEKYMEILNLIVLRVSEIERTTYSGAEREGLIEWYLLQREDEIDTVEQLEQERRVIDKILGRLVRDQYLVELRGEAAAQAASSSAAAAEREGIAAPGTLDASETDGMRADLEGDATLTDESSQRRYLLLHPRIDVDSLVDGSTLE